MLVTTGLDVICPISLSVFLCCGISVFQNTFLLSGALMMSVR